MKQTIYWTKGLPASGKTTWAKKQLAENPGKYVRVNKDDLRAMLHDGAWSKEREKFVLEIRDTLILKTIADNKSVIVDDTNFAPVYEARFREIAAEYSVACECVTFDTDVHTCLQRDVLRVKPVGPKVIWDMFNRYVKPGLSVPEPPAFDPSLSNCIIVDIDGTVARNVGRGHYDWARVGEDAPRELVLRTVRRTAFLEDATVIFLSGRSNICRTETENWLLAHYTSIGVANIMAQHRLLMRINGDSRRDSIVKREIYDLHIRGKYNVTAIFDDRLQVCRMWKELGFGDRLFRVGMVDEDDF